jgi:hypothetical protein
MSTKTYSERRQQVYFVAAREMRKVAAHILDDVVEDAEFTGATARWAKDQARYAALAACELERQGHELCIASPRAETEIHKSKTAYNKSIDRFINREREALRRGAVHA